MNKKLIKDKIYYMENKNDELSYFIDKVAVFIGKNNIDKCDSLSFNITKKDEKNDYLYNYC